MNKHIKGAFFMALLGILSAISISIVWSVQPRIAYVASPTDQTSYLNGPDHTGYSRAETTLTATTFPDLAVIWQLSTPSAISAQPIVGNGMVYWGSWDGSMHGTNLSGKNVWTTPLGSNSYCAPPIGIGSTAALTMIGTRPVILVGGANTRLYALDANTGTVIWSTNDLSNGQGGYIFSSPTIYNGSAYVGVSSSWCDTPLVQGKLYKIDLATGSVQSSFTAAPSGCSGGGIWGSPTIDTNTGILYTTTGNGTCSASTPGNYAEGVLAFRSSNLSLISFYQATADLAHDYDFGSTPTLFVGTDSHGTLRRLVGVQSKDGHYYTFDRANVTQSGLIWSAQISDPGDDAASGHGSISPSAFDGRTLYVAGGLSTTAPAPYGCTSASTQGFVMALNPGTGQVLWKNCVQGPVIGALSAVSGVVVAPEADNSPQASDIDALATTDGHLLFEYKEPLSGPTAGQFDGPVTIAGGHLYAGNTDGTLTAFGLPAVGEHQTLANTALTDLPKTDTDHVYLVGNNHHLYEYLWQSSCGCWSMLDLSADTGTANRPLADGPSGHWLLQGGSIVQDVYVLGTDGHLDEFWFQNGAWHTLDLWALVSPPSNITFIGSPSAFSFTDSSNTVHHSVFVIGINGHLYNYAWTSNAGWNVTDVSAAAGLTGVALTNAPSAHSLIQPGALVQDIYVNATNGHLYEFWFQNGGWHYGDLWRANQPSGNTGITFTGSPSGFSYTDNGGTLHHSVFVIGTNQQLYDYDWRINGGWSVTDVSSTSAALTGSPSGSAFTQTGSLVKDVFVRDRGGKIWEYYYQADSSGVYLWHTNGSLNASIGVTGSPSAASYTFDGQNVRHSVFFAGTDGHLHEWYWEQNLHPWTFVDEGAPQNVSFSGNTPSFYPDSA